MSRRAPFAAGRWARSFPKTIRDEVAEAVLIFAAGAAGLECGTDGSTMLPSFETQRLLVRPRQIADLNACLAMDRDPAVVRYIDVPWRGAEAHRSFVLDRMMRAYPAGLGYWSVVLKLVPAAFLGWVLLIPYDAIGPEIEIGWRFLRSAWGNGFATEASLPVLRHGFETVGLARVVADVHPDNAASLRVAEKLGMHCVGERRIKGKRLRSYALERQEYFAASFRPSAERESRNP
jgi:RimJ/RimL family protein N-acetyltransferase